MHWTVIDMAFYILIKPCMEIRNCTFLLIKLARVHNHFTELFPMVHTIAASLSIEVIASLYHTNSTRTKYSVINSGRSRGQK